MLWYSSRAVKHKQVANIDDIAPSNEAHNSDIGHTSLKDDFLEIVSSKKFEIAVYQIGWLLNYLSRNPISKHSIMDTTPSFRNYCER